MNIVIAGSKLQYQEWMRRNYLNRKEYKYIADIQDLRGIEIDRIYLIGTYGSNPVYHHPKLQEIYEKWMQDKVKGITKMSKFQQFLKELTELSRKHDVYIEDCSCGCCGHTYLRSGDSSEKLENDYGLLYRDVRGYYLPKNMDEL